MKIKIECSLCNGTDPDVALCPKCDGKGHVERSHDRFQVYRLAGRVAITECTHGNQGSYGTCPDCGLVKFTITNISQTDEELMNRIRRGHGGRPGAAAQSILVWLKRSIHLQ